MVPVIGAASTAMPWSRKDVGRNTWVAGYAQELGHPPGVLLIVVLLVAMELQFQQRHELLTAVHVALHHPAGPSPDTPDRCPVEPASTAVACGAYAAIRF
jgi:hypothetical protein